VSPIKVHCSEYMCSDYAVWNAVIHQSANQS